MESKHFHKCSPFPFNLILLWAFNHIFKQTVGPTRPYFTGKDTKVPRIGVWETSPSLLTPSSGSHSYPRQPRTRHNRVQSIVSMMTLHHCWVFQATGKDLRWLCPGYGPGHFTCRGILLPITDNLRNLEITRNPMLFSWESPYSRKSL